MHQTFRRIVERSGCPLSRSVSSVFGRNGRGLFTRIVFSSTSQPVRSETSARQPHRWCYTDTASDAVNSEPFRLLGAAGSQHTVAASSGEESDREKAHVIQKFEERLFEGLKTETGGVPLSRFINGLKETGIQTTDPRIRETISKIRELQTAALGDEEFAAKELQLDRETFMECIRDNIDIIHRSYTDDFVVPNFNEFRSSLDEIYWKCFSNRSGSVATYIPQLSRFDPDYWGVSVCTTDGQRYSIGDSKVPFSIQSGSKPVTYALAVSDLGEDTVHQYVGHEPSGHSFNRIRLGHNNKPHNPLINAGAILTVSLLKNNLKLADRFDYVSNQFRRMTGGEFLGFNNSVFLSERETADRNFALAYYLKENKCFPLGVNLQDTMDLYFQLCSIEVNCESGAVLASTLANGGICPITGDKILDSTAVRNTLSLMHSCGMYDYSGEFAFKVGLPAKSGVSGVILLVVPNVAGFCLWSPAIDRYGNSARSLDFCESLVKTFSFHNYDTLRYLPKQKKDPRHRIADTMASHIVQLLFSASKGDLTALRRMWLAGMNMEEVDYDGRSALHLAAAEGHYDCVRFLLEQCEVPAGPQDRWDQTPYDDAVRFDRDRVVKYLEPLMNQDTTS